MLVQEPEENYNKILTLFKHFKWQIGLFNKFTVSTDKIVKMLKKLKKLEDNKYPKNQLLLEFYNLCIGSTNPVPTTHFNLYKKLKLIENDGSIKELTRELTLALVIYWQGEIKLNTFYGLIWAKIILSTNSDPLDTKLVTFNISDLHYGFLLGKITNVLVLRP
jgi:hypothetical protein